MVAQNIEVLSSGHGLLESPRCAPGSVWFADWTRGQVLCHDLSSGGTRAVAEIASMPLCFDLDHARGQLIVFDSARGRLLRGPLDGQLEDSLDVSALSKGAGNEVLSDGSRVWLNFGNFDPRSGFPSTPIGLLAVVDAAGARVVADTVAFPNGMALTPDGRELVVAESHAGRLTAWTIKDDGSLSAPRVWAQVDGAAPDGISMSPDGTCWYADVPARRVTRVSEGGRVHEVVVLDRGAFSCAYDHARQTLYVTAAHWPGGRRMFDPTHDWDGQLIAVTGV